MACPHAKEKNSLFQIIKSGLFIERTFKVKENRLKVDSNKIKGLMLKIIWENVHGLGYMDFGDKRNNIKMIIRSPSSR